jgi:hypothetical protein
MELLLTAVSVTGLLLGIAAMWEYDSRTPLATFGYVPNYPRAEERRGEPRLGVG